MAGEFNFLHATPEEVIRKIKSLNSSKFQSGYIPKGVLKIPKTLSVPFSLTAQILIPYMVVQFHIS